MSLFSRKPKIRLDEFCRDFYDRNILHAIIGGRDAGSVFFETMRDSVTEADSSFSSIDWESFKFEMTALRFEVFALAWLNQVGEKLAVAQSIFTKSYLEAEDRSDIWEAMEPYNRAIARSSTHGCTPETPTGRGRIAFVDSFRFGLMKSWMKKNLDDPACAGRVINRMLTDDAWKQGVTRGYLMLTLCHRLGCEVNEEAQFRLTAFVIGLYNGSREAIADVKITS
jgi:hypothetical protein